MLLHFSQMILRMPTSYSRKYIKFPNTIRPSSTEFTAFYIFCGLCIILRISYTILVRVGAISWITQPKGVCVEANARKTMDIFRTYKKTYLASTFRWLTMDDGYYENQLVANYSGPTILKWHWNNNKALLFLKISYLVINTLLHSSKSIFDALYNCSKIPIVLSFTLF